MARKSRKNLEELQTPEVQRPIYNVGAYIRLSAVDKKQKGDSIDTQQSIINAFIAEHQDLTLAEVYIDNGISGQTFERAAFQQMLADMENGKINCCITKDLSRLGRNAIDTGFYVEKFFPMNGIRFVAITDDFDSADTNSGGIMLSLKNMVNEAYALDIGRKIRSTKQMLIRNGCYVGRIPPYGYLKSKDDIHKLVPDKYASQIVSKIFEMVNSGESVRNILDWLNESNILPPMKHFYSIGVTTEKQAQSHIHWNKSTIYSILKNRVYCGDLVQGKHKCQSYAVTTISKDEWIVVENTHEAIIDKELFLQVQKLLEKPQGKGSPYTEAKTDNIFLRKIFCGHCGLSMKRMRTSETNYKFHCNTSSMYHKDDCVKVSIGENDLKKIILKFLHEQENQWVDRNEPKLLQNNNTEKEELKQVKLEGDKNSHFLKGLYESLIVGDITDDEYKLMKSSYETKIFSLKQQEKKLQENIYNNEIENDAISKAGVYVQTLKTIADLNKELIEKLVEKILIYEDCSVSVKFRFSDEVFEVVGGGHDE